MTTILHYQTQKDYGQQHSLPSPPDTSSCTSTNSSNGYETEDLQAKKLNVFRLKELPTINLPENYTIDHSIIHQQRQQQNNKSNSSRVTWSEQKKKNQKMHTDDNNHSLPAMTTARRKRSLFIDSTTNAARIIDDEEEAEDDEEEVDVVEEDDSKKEGHKCRDCGKVYKHLNCLFKHRWEHTEQWEYTSSFLLTKHQQVQMLEAASILVNMKKRKRPAPPQSTTLTKKRKRAAAAAAATTTTTLTVRPTMTTNTDSAMNT